MHIYIQYYNDHICLNELQKETFHTCSSGKDVFHTLCALWVTLLNLWTVPLWFAHPQPTCSVLHTQLLHPGHSWMEQQDNVSRRTSNKTALISLQSFVFFKKKNTQWCLCVSETQKQSIFPQNYTWWWWYFNLKGIWETFSHRCTFSVCVRLRGQRALPWYQTLSDYIPN